MNRGDEMAATGMKTRNFVYAGSRYALGRKKVTKKSSKKKYSLVSLPAF